MQRCVRFWQVLCDEVAERTCGDEERRKEEEEEKKEKMVFQSNIPDP